MYLQIYIHDNLLHVQKRSHGVYIYLRSMQISCKTTYVCMWPRVNTTLFMHTHTENLLFPCSPTLLVDLHEGQDRELCPP